MLICCSLDLPVDSSFVLWMNLYMVYDTVVHLHSGQILLQSRGPLTASTCIDTLAALLTIRMLTQQSTVFGLTVICMPAGTSTQEDCKVVSLQL